MIWAIVLFNLWTRVISEIPSIVVESHEHLTLHQTLLSGVKQDDNFNTDRRQSRYHVCGEDVRFTDFNVR